jgi:hypothetical protein
LTTIVSYAFQSLSNLTNVIIGDGVTEINQWAFQGCKNLTTVTICKGVTSIGELAFKGCNSLAYVYCKPTIPPTLYDCNVFNTVNSDVYATFYVPKESVEAYSNAQNWSQILYYNQPNVTIVGYDF